MCAKNARAFLWVTYACFPLKKKAKRRHYKKCSDINLVYCGATWSNWDNGHLLVLQTGCGQDDKFVLRSIAPRQVALTNTVQTLASASNLHLADRNGRVSLGLSDTSDGKLAASWSEVINRFGEDRSKLRWSDVVDITYVKTIGLPIMRHPCLIAKSDSLMIQEVDRAAQYVYHDLNKFKEEDWSPSVSDVDCADFVRCIYLSIEYVELLTISCKINMYVDSGKKKGLTRK